MIIYSIGKRLKNVIKVKITLIRSNLLKLFNKDKVETDVVVKDRVVHYYPNGNIKAECSYKEGKLEGISLFYYPDGKIEAKEFYKDGQLTGLSKRYDRFGKLQFEEYYKDGILVEKKAVG